MASKPTAGPTLSPLQVTFYRRMKLQKVYPVVVRWRNWEKPRSPTQKYVNVRLLLAGAQVLPNEHILDVSRPDAQATFYVTPLARGWLRAQRLEVVLNGRKVQEIPLASKVVSQRLTRWCLLLAIFVPWILLMMRAGGPNLLREGIATHVPKTAEVIRDRAPALEDMWDRSWEWVGGTYETFVNLLADRSLVFPVAGTFLLLALISWLVHRDKRSTRVGKPIPLVADREDE